MEHGTDQPGEGVVSGGVLIYSKGMPPITEPERVKIFMFRGGDRERYFFLYFGEVWACFERTERSWDIGLIVLEFEVNG
jgi:hypothetical protein